MNTPYFERPLFFFDQSRFRRALVDQPYISVFKDAISAANTQFDMRFREGESIRKLINERALFIDFILHYAWHQFEWDENISLLAVGGYGRGELHPQSDIDLLLLQKKDSDKNHDSIERFLALLWDIGLDIGQSVRSIKQCVSIAKTDITVATSVMECRTLVGDDALRTELLAKTSAKNIWPADEFFRAKWDEQVTRHHKHNNTAYNLEPNIKNAPGGLRDIQVISWVAKRFFDVPTLMKLQGTGFFNDEEFALLINGEEFLWRVRYGLHMIAGRAEDRLLFDHQRELATLLGYRDNDTSLAIEQFMHKYYRLVSALRALNDVLLQFLDEAIFHKGKSKSTVALNERFQLRDNYIEANHVRVFEENPYALLEIFVLMAQQPEIGGVRASTIRLIRESRNLIDEEFRNTPAHSALFLELLRAPYDISAQLRRMSRYGILGRYLPEFGKITGQMQHDLFHIYTVDAHTLLVVKNLCDFRSEDAKEKFPIAAKIIKNIRKPELIYIAGLYHDIGKGRGGDHSKLGAVDAEEFCQRHGLSQRDTELVCWLVRQHLLISAVSQKKDLSDPDVIHDFAQVMGDKEHLDYLTALTTADINATNPDLWNTWKASLIRQLYLETQQALERGLENPIDSQELINSTQQKALEILRERNADIDAVQVLWKRQGDDYFLHEDYRDVVWHSEALIKNPDDPIITLIKETTDHQHEGATQIFISTQNRDNIFAAVATALDHVNLNIQSAQLYTSNSNYTLDTFYVLDENNDAIGNNPEKVERIHKALHEELSQVDDYSDIINRRTPRRLKYFAMPTETSIAIDSTSGQTVLEVITPDRTGLLARISRIFIELGIGLQNAKIATLGERVEDVFFIADKNGEPLTDPALCRELQEEICRQLDENIEDELNNAITF